MPHLAFLRWTAIQDSSLRFQLMSLSKGTEYSHMTFYSVLRYIL